MVRCTLESSETLVCQGFRRQADEHAFRPVSYLRKRLSQFVGQSTFFLATM